MEQFLNLAKQHGLSFALMAVIAWVSWDRMNTLEIKYDRKIEILENEVRDCNRKSQELLVNQIEKNNLLLERNTEALGRLQK